MSDRSVYEVNAGEVTTIVGGAGSTQLFIV